MGKGIYSRFFRGTTVTPADGIGKVRLKHRELFLSASLKEATEDTVSLARDKLRHALSLLNATPLDPNVVAALRVYFMTAMPPSAAHLSVIRTVLGKTAHGISANFSIKLANPSASYWRKQGHTKAEIKKVAGYVSEYPGGEKGDIHVGPAVMKNVDLYRSVLYFIHEATHKYADTKDHDMRGYVKADGSGYDGLMSPDECRCNADSYAWFVAAVNSEAWMLRYGADPWSVTGTGAFMARSAIRSS
jgi:hypothetical protein